MVLWSLYQIKGSGIGTLIKDKEGMNCLDVNEYLSMLFSIRKWSYTEEFFESKVKSVV